jgi:ribosomal protein S6--L-glutamate ligase
MRLISFDPFRTLGIPGVHVIKPEHYLEQVPDISRADWNLFPEYWQVNSIYYGLNPRIFP